MKYYYEFKYKNGTKISGHNLEKIEFLKNNYIKLSGVDIIQTNIDYEEQHWSSIVCMKEIEYLKIEPMLEKELKDE